jgi:parvulin-like peptidyl-prolyl isomerase
MWAFAMPARAQDASPDAEETPTPVIPADAAPDKINEVVATVGGKDVTRTMLFWYNAAMPKSGVTASDVFKLPPSGLKKIVDDLAITREAAKRALAPNSGVSTETMAAYDAARERILAEMVEAREVDAKIPEASSQEIEECYSRNKTVFTSPFSFCIRHIFVSTYQPVVSKEGDTLESLAKTISGDAKKADGILVDNDAKSPRAPNYSEGNPLVKPLEPGEHLLVPMSPEAKKTKLAKIERAMSALKAGDDFTSTALKYSENDAQGTEIEGADQAGRPVLPAIMENIKKTHIGKYTPIFETKHGYNIMLVTRKTEEKVAPLKDVEGAVRQYLKSRKRVEALEHFTQGLYKMAELKIDFAKIKDPDVPGAAVVAHLGNKSYKRQDFLAKDLGKTAKDMRDDDLWPQIRASAKLKHDLRVLRALQLGIDKTPEYRARMESIPDRLLRNGWLAAQQKSLKTETITPEQAKEFFEKNREEFLLLPSYTFCLLAVKATGVTPEASKEAEAKAGDLVRDAHTLDEFKAVVQKQGERISGMGENGLLENRGEPDLPPALTEALKALEPGKMTPPVFVSPYAMVAWLIKVEPGRAATYEEAKEKLPEFVRQVKLSRFPKDLVESLLKEANVVMVKDSQ